MGSVSSLIPGQNLHSKHCKALGNKGKKGHQSKKTGRALDGLLKYGFSQDSCSANNSKVNYHSSKNDDFFYIKVSNKPRAAQDNFNSAEESQARTVEMDKRGGPLELVLLTGKQEKSIETALTRPTAFNPIFPRRESSSMETHNNLSTILGKRISPIDRLKDLQDPKLESSSGTFSDSGRNSMSSLPTHSTSGSSQMDNLSNSTNYKSDAFSWMIETNGGCNSTNGNRQHAAPLGVPSIEPKTDITGNLEHLLENRFCFSDENSRKPSPTGGCVRSPISMDDSLIQQLEQKLLERESELADLQISLEEKESDTCQLFEEKQRYCAEEMKGLKQQCSTKLRQVSQRALKAQKLLQLQVMQLQQDKERLQEQVEQLSSDRNAAENQLRIYESQKTLIPTLEETQWEVCQKSGEISLLKQQLRDSQADAGNKLSEIVSLKSILKESRCKMQELERKIKECEEDIHQRNVEVEVSKNEFQRKKNEADLLREKVNKLEADIKGLKQDIDIAKEEHLQITAMKAKIEEQQLQLQQTHVKAEISKSQDVEDATKTQSHTDMNALQWEVERLRTEVKEEKQKKHKMMSTFQQERQTWVKEKDKVIRYQKQLQYNYLQMYRKNIDLEKILKELTAEMDTRTEVDIDIHSSDLNFDKIVATEI
ncbi:hypothetical protein DNTS_015197 [Danionella cerebrum]|uniref:Leucine zipper tumor suppressor 1 n=1 Tax=Danionella cerebrum TaxID=2873325 RepID=A0A553NJJ4_9TELE|nr:hypothetical protein DNTS_015197 [Danionella translucida]TRY65589.1 hypothetical protein DNTS_015197 [Danionella translucida]